MKAKIPVKLQANLPAMSYRLMDSILKYESSLFTFNVFLK